MKESKLTEKINKLQQKKLVKHFMLFSTQLKRDNINSYASSCAFFLFLSLIPMAIVFCAILPYTPLKEEDLVILLTNSIPEYMSDLIVSIVDEVYDKSIGLLSIAIVTALWSAGKGVNALIVGLNAIEHVPVKKNTIVVRLFSSLYTLIFLASLVLFLVLIVYGNLAADFLVANYPALGDIFQFFVHFRTFISILLMTAVFMVLYAELPSNRMKIRNQMVGALFTSVGWTLFSFLFSLYVSRFNAFSVYGSFTTIIIMMIWLYFLMYIVFFGANLNKYLRPLVMIIDKRLVKRERVKAQKESLDD